jgi:hypothetical protein
LILAQAGIDVHFLPEITWVSDFAYDASPNIPAAGATRPSGDLSTMHNSANGAPIFSDPDVINMIFVEIVPAFAALSENSANGFARVDGNAIAMQVGTNLVGFQGGLDVIAGVVAHEIGHNLGLPHEANGGANLMSPSGTSDQLTAAQITNIFTNNNGTDGFDFAKTIPAPAQSFSSWLSDNSLTGDASSDQDGDGQSNFLEFCFGLDPRKRDGDRLSRLQVPSSTAVTVNVRKQPNALEAGVVYAVQSSTNLTQWLNQGQTGSSITTLSDSSETLSVRLEPSTAAARYYRYSASRPTAALLSAPPLLKSAAVVEELPAAPHRYSDCHLHGCGCVTLEE